MKTVLRLVNRTMLFLIGMYCMCLLLGEPSESMSMTEVVFLKLGGFVGVVVCVKLWLRTMSKREYNDIMNEEV